MQHAVALNDHVDFIAIAIAVVPQQALLGIVMVRLQQLGNNIVFEDCADGRIFIPAKSADISDI